MSSVPTSMDGSESLNGPVVNDVPMQSCPICNSEFPFGDDISTHYSTEHQNVFDQGGKNNQCLICERKLATKKSLTRHVRNLHFKKQNSTLDLEKQKYSKNLKGVYLCGICKKVFNWEYNLAIHMKTIHEDQRKEFACTSCSLKFTSKFNLSRHVLTQH